MTTNQPTTDPHGGVTPINIPGTPIAVAYQSRDGSIWTRLNPGGGTDWATDDGRHHPSYGALLDAEEPLTPVYGWCENCEQPVTATQRYEPPLPGVGLWEHSTCPAA